MKRLNPITNLPFKQGDIREDGKVFRQYDTKYISKNGYFYETWVVKSHIDDKRKTDRKHILNHQKQNKEYYNNHTAKRRAAKLQRTPTWLSKDDLWLIQQAYELAELRTRLFGTAWHVDHIIPLQGKLVSGLHVPTNLRVIPGIENCKKNNAYQP